MAVRTENELISVVLCTTAERRSLDGCLASLRALVDDHHEIVVIENRPVSVLDGAELAPWGARVVHEPTGGLDRARNRGIAESTGEIVAFVDDDCTVHEKWLSGLRDAFVDPEVDFVTGHVRAASTRRRSERCFENSVHLRSRRRASPVG